MRKNVQSLLHWTMVIVLLTSLWSKAVKHYTTYSLTELQTSLLRHEGKKESAYRDSLGYWTIGVGHFLGGGKDVVTPRMTVLSTNEIDALLLADIETAEYRLDNICANQLSYDWRLLDDVRQRVLVEMSFNLGYRLSSFKKFFAAVRMRDWSRAAEEMLDSQWATQVGGRARNLAYMLETGEDL